MRGNALPLPDNLTSQFWSNVMLNPLDWFVSRELGCPAFVRYVDDFALFAGSKAQLYRWKAAIIERLSRLRLTAHEAQAQVVPVEHGIPWLGFVVYPAHRRVKRRNVVNFRRRLARRTDDYLAGRITFAELDASVQGWINHISYADTWGLRRATFSRHRLPPRPEDT